MDHSLAGCLDHIGFHAVTKSRDFAFLQGPGSDQCLVQEDFLVAIWRFLRLDYSFPFLVPACPPVEVCLPFTRDFGEDVDSRPRVFAAFWVVRRSAIQTVSLLALPITRKIAEFRCDDRRRARIFADFVER